MVIREGQLEALTDSVQADAEKELVAHCRQFEPRLFEAAGEPGVHEAVRLGIKRSKGYGFTDEPQVRFYIDTMLVLGSHFDTDPQFPWAAETLQDQFSPPHVRAFVLHGDLTRYLERVMGEENEHARDALDRFLDLPQQLPGPELRTIQHLRQWLARLYPRKSAELSDDQLARISSTATNEAHQFGIPGGDAILGSLMAIYGHGVTHDPLYPWIPSVLRDPLINNPEGRLQRLYERWRAYAGHARKYLAENEQG